MKREGTIGAAAFVALAAVVGFSLQTGPKQEVSGRADRASAIKRSKPTVTKGVIRKYLPGCSSLEEELEEFLEIDELSPPTQCIVPGNAPPKEKDLTQKTSQLKFVIALLPDPVHTHLSVLFDQFAVAIQEGAQDEKYDFDSSWLPWDDNESPYALFADEKASNLEKEERETQPGIILFRKALDCPAKAGESKNGCEEDLGAPPKKGEGALSRRYSEGLVVFVVGEEATHGIHRDQFRNAVDWIAALHPTTDTKIRRIAILGPTFSGSLPSVAQVLSEPEITRRLDLSVPRDGQGLAIYSGSVSGNTSAQAFQKTFDSRVRFQSFVQDDDEILRRFCNYITHEQTEFDPSKIAIISEDETAYGKSGVRQSASIGTGEEPEKGENDKDRKNECAERALKLYYPRDISALRGAYQTKSLFDVGTSPQPADAQRRNLPSDLADPAGKVHDSIRSYGGNQTPLTQEATLLEIVAALRELHARYILLRSSNALDQLFLTNFLRRSYADGRIVIFGADLMFIRERGSTGLSGTMTLSTYPLFPLERDWTEHQSLPAADRVFSSDTTEGTYVAFRLLLNDSHLNVRKQETERCQVFEKAKDKGKDEYAIFVPPVSCGKDPPIPDYSPPFWTLAEHCGEMESANKGERCPYPGPATWLSVIGVNRFWPMASLTRDPSASESEPLGLWVNPKTSDLEGARAQDPGGRPKMPLGMKVFLLVLVGFSLFHAWCCWSGSYTAKPAFRAQFASTGDWRHPLLVFAGSTIVAFLAIVVGWGCGVFYQPAPGLVYPWLARYSMTFVCLTTCGAVLAQGYTTWRLSKDIPKSADLRRASTTGLIIWNGLELALLLVAMQVFYQVFVISLEGALIPENRVLAYWRAMHLTSGVSPVVPIISILAGLYLSFWFTLHGLALFGPDRPCLPLRAQLELKFGENVGNFLRMFSQEDSAAMIEDAAIPVNWKMVAIGSGLFVLFLLVPWKIAVGVPVRSLGAEIYALAFLVGLDACCTLAIVEAWRLYEAWEELRQLLAFLDRLPLRRTLAVLHGFSWGSVWKMSGNVLEVRYKVISRQMECMNHTNAALRELLKNPSDPGDIAGALSSLTALAGMHNAGVNFAQWYSTNYKISRAGDLTSFCEFQKSVAIASGILLTKLLVPAWRKEKGSLITMLPKDAKEEATPNPPAPPQSEKVYIRNAEEFVCLNYLGFIQNVLGRLRTMAMTILVLFLASAVAMSAYPFDPRQALSGILITLFLIVGTVIVKVYADMHRDATLSHVTNTKPGELGTEFWFKIIGFGFAPLIGLLARLFPGITDFLFSWVQPGISSLK